jgi:hypothetical protein
MPEGHAANPRVQALVAWLEEQAALSQQVVTAAGSTGVAQAPNRG